MNKYPLLVAILTLALLLPTAINAEEAHVLYVIDGDTLVVRLKNKIEHIRIVGIDTPELHDKKSGVAQCYAQEARRELINRAAKKIIQIERDPLTQNRDVYGRYLRIVHAGALSLGEHLIKNGFARVYTRSPATHSDTLMALQLTAQKNKKGLWGACKK